MPPGALPRAALAAPTLLARRRWAAKETSGSRAEIQTFLACLGIVHGNSWVAAPARKTMSRVHAYVMWDVSYCGPPEQQCNGMDRERARGATMDREHQEVAAPPWRPASLVLRRPAYIVRRRIRAAGHLKLRAGPAALPQAAAVRRLAWFCSVMPRAPAIIYLFSRFACVGTV